MRFLQLFEFKSQPFRLGDPVPATATGFKISFNLVTEDGEILPGNYRVVIVRHTVPRAEWFGSGRWKGVAMCGNEPYGHLSTNHLTDFLHNDGSGLLQQLIDHTIKTAIFLDHKKPPGERQNIASKGLITGQVQGCEVFTQ
jgi:hypothetical protein